MLYLITNRLLLTGLPYERVIEDAVKGGVDAVIVREKDLCYNELLQLAEALKNRLKPYRVKLIINGSPKIALPVADKVAADGYHTSFFNFMEQKPRFDGMLGVSVHSPEEAVQAERGGADYVLAGHIFETDCKKGLEPKGIKMLCDMKALVNIPVIALGGISVQNVQKVLEAGAAGIAVMSGIMSSEKPFDAAKLLKDQLVPAGIAGLKDE